jgi:hemolysin III
MSIERRLVKDPVSGFSHLAGLFVALVGVGFLVGRALDVPRVVYGVCLVALYAASSAYHLFVASDRVTARLRRLDHIAIFLMVAGTCTPVFHHALSGRARVVMLVGIWTAAAIGVAFKLLWMSAPRWLYTALYLAMGWAVVLQWSAVVHGLPRAVFAFVIAGGVAYTLGAIVYASKRPDPFPRVFGFHEIWHLFVLAGSTLHFLAIALLPA